MAATKLQPNPEPELQIMTVYPSISVDGLGRFIGRAMYCIPLPFSKNVKLSALVFGLLLAPIGFVLYVIQKLIGPRYLLTNRSIQSWSSIGTRLFGSVPLQQIAEIEVVEKPGQAFFHAADLNILDSGGNTVLTLDGVVRAEVFRHTILEARDARVQVESALATIGARATV